MSAPISNVRPAPDKVLTDIADYTTKYAVTSSDAYETARHCLMDTLGCGVEALEYPACTKLLEPELRRRAATRPPSCRRLRPSDVGTDFQRAAGARQGPHGHRRLHDEVRGDQQRRL